MVYRQGGGGAAQAGRAGDRSGGGALPYRLAGGGHVICDWRTRLHHRRDSDRCRGDQARQAAILPGDASAQRTAPLLYQPAAAPLQPSPAKQHPHRDAAATDPQLTRCRSRPAGGERKDGDAGSAGGRCRPRAQQPGGSHYPWQRDPACRHPRSHQPRTTRRPQGAGQSDPLSGALLPAGLDQRDPRQDPAG